MGKGGGSETQTSEPWSVQKPYLEGGFQTAADLFNQGATLPALSADTANAWNRIRNQANSGSTLYGMSSNAVGDAMRGGAAGTSALTSIAQGGAGQGPGAGTYAAVQGRNFGTDAIAGRLGAAADQAYANPAFNLLAGTAGGDYLNANPYLDRQYDAAANAVTRNFRDATVPAIDGSFARAGRVGSGQQVMQQKAAEQALGETLGDLSANLYGQNYAQERQNQLAAANSTGQLYAGAQGLNLNALNSLSSRDLSGTGLQLQAAGAADSAWNADQARRLSAAQQLSGNALAGIGALPTVQGAGYYDANALSALGGAEEAYQNAANTASYDQLARYLGSISGNYGGTTTAPKQGGGSTLGALGGLGMLAASFFTGGAAAPIMASAGANMFARSVR